MEEITLNNGGSNPGVKGFKGNTLQQLPVVDWLADLPEAQLDTDLVEVQFKNTRKGYFVNSAHIAIEKGDMVAVEANPGHDIGVVTLMGRLVLSQIKKNRINMDRYEVRKVYRKVKPVDMEKYEEAKSKEQDTMIKARKIAKDMQLDMKIGDVEYQGDGSKAIFYYIADDRVDFRQLIKVFAEVFRVRIEMKQIGARQEAGRIGGIGPCGRELCCTTWMSNFVSVSTTAARYQDLSTNPLKLAGQCAKIKCCVNFEAPMYVDAQKDFPSKDIPLETAEGTYYFFKADVFKRQLTYSSDQNIPANLQVISVERAKEIMAINRRGEKVISLVEKDGENATAQIDYQNVVGQDSLTRFDKKHHNAGGSRRFERRDRGSRRPNAQQSNNNSHRSNYRNRREEGNE
jgi:cell fate regulator YaaT (PSP1 superfamily)